MKLGPKEIKVVNQYLIRPVKNRLKEIFEKKSLPQLQTADEGRTAFQDGTKIKNPNPIQAQKANLARGTKKRKFIKDE